MSKEALSRTVEPTNAEAPSKRPGSRRLVAPVPTKNETKTSLKKDVKAACQYIADIQLEHETTISVLEAAVQAEKDKVQALEEAAAESNLPAEKDKVRKLEDEAELHNQEWRDLRRKFTQKVRESRRQSWELEDVNITIAQLTGQKEAAEQALRLQEEKRKEWMNEVMASNKALVDRLTQGSPLYRTANDDKLQQVYSDLRLCSKKLHNLEYVRDSQTRHTKLVTEKVQIASETEARLRHRQGLLYGEWTAHEQTTRWLHLAYHKLQCDFARLEKGNPDVYLQSCDAVERFEQRIGLLEAQNLQLSHDRFELYERLAGALGKRDV